MIIDIVILILEEEINITRRLDLRPVLHNFINHV